MNIDFKIGDVYERLEKLANNKKNRYIVLRGGTSSGKSVSALQWLAIYALSNSNKTISIISESMIKAKRGLIPEFKNLILKDLMKIVDYNKTESTFTFSNNSVIRFISADEEKKVVGLRNDILYIDEANTVKKEVLDQLSFRTREHIILSFNPTAKFPFYEEIEVRKDFVEDVSTYLDNPYLEQSIIDDLLERAKKDLNFKRVMIDGEWGTTEGLVFEENIDWFLIDELPEKYDEEIYTLDWGFKHPTVISKIRFVKNDIYAQQLTYEGDLINSQIARKIQEYNPNNKWVIADSAEAKSIADLSRTYGIKIKGINKLNILPSIDNLKTRNLFVTKDSIDGIKELRYWSYDKKKTDKKNRPLPIDIMDDFIDTVRYGCDYYFKPRNKKQIRTITI